MVAVRFCRNLSQGFITDVPKRKDLNFSAAGLRPAQGPTDTQDTQRAVKGAAPYSKHHFTASALEKEQGLEQG